MSFNVGTSIINLNSQKPCTVIKSSFVRSSTTKFLTNPKDRRPTLALINWFSISQHATTPMLRPWELSEASRLWLSRTSKVSSIYRKPYTNKSALTSPPPNLSGLYDFKNHIGFRDGTMSGTLESGVKATVPVIQVSASSKSMFQTFLGSVSRFTHAIQDNEQDFTWFGTVYQIHPFPPSDNESQRTDCITSVKNIDHHFQTRCTVIHFSAPILPPKPQDWAQLYTLPVFEGIFPTFNAHTIEPTGYNLFLRSAPDTFTLDANQLHHYPGFPTELLPPPVLSTPQQPPRQNNNPAAIPPMNQHQNHTQRLQRLAARITRTNPALPTPRQATTPIVSPTREPPQKKRMTPAESTTNNNNTDESWTTTKLPAQPNPQPVATTTSNNSNNNNRFASPNESHYSSSSKTMAETEFPLPTPQTKSSISYNNTTSHRQLGPRQPWRNFSHL